MSPSTTKLIIAYEVGDRSVDTGLELLENLRERLASPFHLATDGYNVYLSAVEQVFGEEAKHLLRTEERHNAQESVRYGPGSYFERQWHIRTLYCERW